MKSPKLSVMLPVDGYENSDRAVLHLISLYERLAPVEVRLIHVLIRPILVGEDVAVADGGKDALRSAQTLLDRAGVAYTSEVRRGHVPQEIANYAKELKCSAIVMGTRGMGSTDQIFGSIVRQVVALTTLPVTVVK